MKVRIFPEVRADLTLNLFVTQFDSQPSLLSRSTVIVQEINGTYVPRLDEIEAAQRVEVRRITCHRGQQQPKLIEDVLDEQLAENGLEATLNKYAELREAFYGSHSYDFNLVCLRRP